MTLPRFEHYVTLGDSIQIDDYPGDGHGAASLLAAELRAVNPGLKLSPLAMDGATSGQIIDWQLPYFEPLCDGSPEGPAPDLVTLTVGGNDFIGFFGAAPEQVAAGIATVRANVDRVLQTVRAKAPKAVILVGTIYDPSDGTGELGDVTAKDWPEGPQALLDLNTTLLEAAAGVGGIGTDIHGLFLGHGKTAGDIAQTPPGSLDDHCWFCNVIEPNRAGAKAVADLWAETLRSL